MWEIAETLYNFTRIFLRVAVVICWVAVFMILSLGARIVAFTRRGRPELNTAGVGHYDSQAKRRWQDEESGQWYPCSDTEQQSCEVIAKRSGLYWRESAKQRMHLHKRYLGGVIDRYVFSAVTVNGPTSEVVAVEEFPLEARRNLTLENLEPDDHNRATQALDELERTLAKKGWEPDGQPPGAAWYARRYERPLIRRNEPIEAEAATG
jgi:hypothetical protein